MRRLHIVLLAACQLSAARTNGFRIDADLMAFPQYEVVFADSYISENDARRLLENNSPAPTVSVQPAQSTADSASGTDSHIGGERDEAYDTDGPPGQTYEVLNMSPHRYLCSIPVVQPPPPENQTANELAKAEEARELSRATVDGWDLLHDLEGSCLYFMSGWWSYSFCKNREIVQFHAQPAIPNGQPPRRDPHTAEYVLGQVPAIPASAEHQTRRQPDDEPLPAGLQVKGDQRYLVQKLEGGTVCDLTGRERTIEVQYHCVPGMENDRIGWIKEVTICSYLMVVNTPRLCNDVAFLPPEEAQANPISCQLILSEGEAAETPLLDSSPSSTAGKVTHATSKGQQREYAETRLTEQATLAKEPVNIGGVIVGARNILSGADEAGKPPTKLAPPRSYLPPKKTPAQERFIEMVAQAASKDDGGRVEVLTAEELEDLDLDPEVIREMREQMEKIAGDAGWKLEIVGLDDAGDLRELRGYIDGADEDDEEAGEEGKAAEGGNDEKDKGSEEKFFKEEL